MRLWNLRVLVGASSADRLAGLSVADGYNGNRVATFDKDGKFVWTSGELGMPSGKETRPGYFNTVRAIAADPVTRRIYVSDRSSCRIQVLDGDSGKVVDWWPVGTQQTCSS